MTTPRAAKTTRQIAIPTIGTGGSVECDGQVLVMEDMLGLNPSPPRFVREYAHLGADIEAAVKAYAADVRSRNFPGKEHVYSMLKKGEEETSTRNAREAKTFTLRWKML